MRFSYAWEQMEAHILRCKRSHLYKRRPIVPYPLNTHWFTFNLLLTLISFLVHLLKFLFFTLVEKYGGDQCRLTVRSLAHYEAVLEMDHMKRIWRNLLKDLVKCQVWQFTLLGSIQPRLCLLLILFFFKYFIFLLQNTLLVLLHWEIALRTFKLLCESIGRSWRLKLWQRKLKAKKAGGAALGSFANTSASASGPQVPASSPQIPTTWESSPVPKIGAEAPSKDL